MTVVIKDGGTLRFEGNRCWYGYTDNTLEIRGGVLSDASWGSSEFIGYGTIRLVDGTYEMRRTPFMSDGSVVDWQGGTIAVKGPGKMVFVNLTNNGGSLELDENANVFFPARTTALDLREMVINGTNCTIAIDSATVTPTIETLRIGADGLWHEGLLSAFGNPTVTNMAFDDGAIWQSDGTPLTVSGTLLFGDSVRYWFLPAARGTVAHAEGGISGNPVWQQFKGCKREFPVTGCDLLANGVGLMLIFRRDGETPVASCVLP